MKRTAAYVGEDGGYHLAMNTLTTGEVDRLRKRWEAICSGSSAGRVLMVGETGPELIETTCLSDKHRTYVVGMGSKPAAKPTYTPTVQRIDWLAELRETKRQALIGAAILGVLVLTFIAGCLRLAGVL